VFPRLCTGLGACATFRFGDMEELAKVYAPDLTFEKDTLSYLVDDESQIIEIRPSSYFL